MRVVDREVAERLDTALVDEDVAEPLTQVVTLEDAVVQQQGQQRTADGDPVQQGPVDEAAVVKRRHDLGHP